MNPFLNLSAENGNQIEKYLRFFRKKREGILRTITREFSDVKNERLQDGLQGLEELDEFVDFLTNSIETQIAADLSSLINMSALTVSQLLECAQEKNVEINIETSSLENQDLLEAIEKLNLDAMPKNQKRGVGELVSFQYTQINIITIIHLG
jgi:hypothetical protein